jgi:hypothetical protein
MNGWLDQGTLSRLGHHFSQAGKRELGQKVGAVGDGVSVASLRVFFDQAGSDLGATTELATSQWTGH